MQVSNSVSFSVLIVIGFCLAIGIGSIGAADYLPRLANKRVGNITPRMFQIFGFAIIGCNLLQLMFLMLDPQSPASGSAVDSSDVQYSSSDGGYTVSFSGTP